MAEQPTGEKTLPASQRKIERERERGNVARSTDLNASATLLVALLCLWLFGPGLIRQLLAASSYFLGDAYVIGTDPGSLRTVLVQVGLITAPATLGVMLVLLAAGIAINVIQIGPLFAPQTLTPRFDRLNPFQGFRRFVTLRTLVELAKALFKLAVVGLVIWLTFRGRWDDVLSLMHLGPEAAARAVWDMLATVWWRIALAMLALGILDFGYQRWQYLRDLMMTQQEAREELKQLEGDPRIKQRIRQIQRQMAMQRMMKAVPEADVVITNPTTYAVALRYDVRQMTAPTVTAKGARLVAERIRALAIEHDVPIVERPELARTLYRSVEVGQTIREDLFRAVAEVLAYVYRIDRRESKRKERAEARLAPA